MTVFNESAIPTLTLDPITRTQLALFAGASHDHTPIHIDIDFVKASGGEDVFAQGMLVMANMARVVTRWKSQQQLRELSGRFLDIVRVGDQLSISAEITERIQQGKENCLTLDITVVNQTGHKIMTGHALVVE